MSLVEIWPVTAVNGVFFEKKVNLESKMILCDSKFIIFCIRSSDVET